MIGFEHKDENLKVVKKKKKEEEFFEISKQVLLITCFLLLRQENVKQLFLNINNYLNDLIKNLPPKDVSA